MNINHGYVGFGLLMSLAVASPVMAITPEEFNNIADDIFAPVISQYDIPGLTVGITWRGEEYIYTTGMADRDAGVPVTPDTLFELGSISKTFNATLAALAEEQGKLSLDDTVSGHFPQLEGSAFGGLSLMDLATHHSGGLPLQVPDEVPDDAGLISWLKEWKPAGEERAYSNISIGFLGQVSGQRYDQPYAEAVMDHVITPLGLNSTFINVPDAAMKRYAFGYSKDADQPIRVNPGMLDAESYGVKSSAADMLRFLKVNLGDVSVPADITAAIAKTHHGQTETKDFTQAMIWERYAWPASRDQLLAGNAVEIVMEPQPATRLDHPDTNEKGVYFGKTGSTNGFAAYAAFIPDEDLGVVLLANRNFPLRARVDAALSLIQEVLEQEQ